MQHAEERREQEVVFLMHEGSHPCEDVAKSVRVKKICYPRRNFLDDDSWTLGICFLRCRFEPLQCPAQTGRRMKLGSREQGSVRAEVIGDNIPTESPSLQANARGTGEGVVNRLSLSTKLFY